MKEQVFVNCKDGSVSINGITKTFPASSRESLFETDISSIAWDGKKDGIIICEDGTKATFTTDDATVRLDRYIKLFNEYKEIDYSKFPCPDGQNPEAFFRRTRDEALRKTDFAMQPDVWPTLSEEKQKALLEYRQAMRDITDQHGFPWAHNFCDAPWPVNPLTGEVAIAYKFKNHPHFDKLKWSTRGH